MKTMINVALTVLLIGMIGVVITFNAFGKEDYNEEKVIHNDQIENIQIETDSTDIIFIPTTGEKITLQLKGKLSKKIKNVYKLEVEERENELNVIVDRKNKFTFGNMVDSIKLYVEVPQKLYETISLKTTSGDMKVEEIKGKEISLKANSGEINIQDGTAENSLNIKATSGDITMTDIQGKTLNIKANSGGIIAKNQAAIDSEFTTTSGDIELENITGNIEVTSSSGSSKIENEEVSGDIVAHATSGDVMVTYSKKPASLEVDFRGSSGEGVIDMDGFMYEEKAEDVIIGKIGDGVNKIRVRTSSGDFYLGN